MNYIIMDLEWNNTYSKKKKGYFNEIIEIGAVMLDESFIEIDSFSQVIRSQIGKKLRSSVKKLTNISEEEIQSGELFTKTFSEFRKWVGDEKNTFITWGNTDVRVLIDNFRYLNGTDTIPFMNNYCDLQKCYQKYSNGKDSMQPGLHSAAEQLGIDFDKYNLHRALDDSLLTADILRNIYSKELIEAQSSKCDSDFYKKLFYKPKVITNIDNPLVDKTLFHHCCEKCSGECTLKEPWKYHNQFFRSVYFCENCGVYYKVNIRYKILFDTVDVRKISSVFNPEEVKKKPKRSSLED